MYEAWFLFGFWSHLATVAMMLVTVTLLKYWQTAGQVCGVISTLLCVINGHALVYLGALWRYSGPGKVAAGDLLERSEDTTTEEWAEQLKAAQ